MRKTRYIAIRTVFAVICALLCGPVLPARAVEKTELLIIGGGASGTMAAIQSARMGVKTLLIEETNWLGGMLTAAGVSAIDGDHQLPAGLWGELREKLYKYYGGPAAVETGWVSNTLFEPSVGNRLLKEMADLPNLTVWYQAAWQNLSREGDTWRVTIRKGNKPVVVEAKLLIDATELGDVMAAAGADYDLGMDSRYDTQEEAAPPESNDIIQDLTYVAILKDYGKGKDKTIPRPAGYDPSVFKCCCDVADPAGDGSPLIDCNKMLTYGRLPNHKYMINWPKCGNDIYLNIIEKDPAEREVMLKEAKLHTLRFIYYMQTELGYKNLGLADDEFPTADKLPMIPYHREARRLKGLVQFTLNDVAQPYEQATALYRTGIAVGDYPIDHHHLKNPAAPAIDFVKIKVPSYSVPMGSLIPERIKGLIVAEKSISVTNIVNGATRLQPVVLQIGQAAGVMAALCIRQQKDPSALKVREVQQELLKARGYLLPFIDVRPSDPQFEVIQKIGATGILKGYGVPYKWANQTWFYPEMPVPAYELVKGLRPYYPVLESYWDASGEMITLPVMEKILKQIEAGAKGSAGAGITEAVLSEILKKNGIILKGKELSRRAVAVLIEQILHPFERDVDIQGALN